VSQGPVSPIRGSACRGRGASRWTSTSCPFPSLTEATRSRAEWRSPRLAFTGEGSCGGEAVSSSLTGISMPWTSGRGSNAFSDGRSADQNSGTKSVFANSLLQAPWRFDRPLWPSLPHSRSLPTITAAYPCTLTGCRGACDNHEPRKSRFDPLFSKGKTTIPLFAETGLGKIFLVHRASSYCHRVSSPRRTRSRDFHS